MTRDDALCCFQELGLPPAPEAFLNDWTASAAETIALDADYLTARADYLDFPQELTAALCRSAEAVTEPQQRLMQHIVFKIKQAATDVYFFPTGEDKPDPLLNALVFLQLIDHVRSQHHERAIDTAVTRDTLGDLLIWINDYKRKHDVYGLAQSGWLKRHFMQGLFKLGRLQFEPVSLHDPIQVYRHRRQGDIMIACRPGQELATDGRYLSANGNGISATVTDLVEKDTTVTATFFNPATGLADLSPQTISLKEYEPVLSPGACVLSVHIDASGPMTPDACRASFEQAMPFFRKHFPEITPQAFYCSSWLLDTTFAQYPKPESNILQFQSFWHIYARAKTGDHEFFMRVWAKEKKEINLDTAPKDSSLQRAVAEHVQSGGYWNDMAGLIFPDEIE